MFYGIYVYRNMLLVITLYVIEVVINLIIFFVLLWHFLGSENFLSNNIMDFWGVIDFFDFFFNFYSMIIWDIQSIQLSTSSICEVGDKNNVGVMWLGSHPIVILSLGLALEDYVRRYLHHFF